MCVIASPYAKASGLKTLFKPWETCFLIGTKSVNLACNLDELCVRQNGDDIAKKDSDLGHLKNVG
jgi:hypothetical protein